MGLQRRNSINYVTGFQTLYVYLKVIQGIFSVVLPQSRGNLQWKINPIQIPMLGFFQSHMTLSINKRKAIKAL